MSAFIELLVTDDRRLIVEAGSIAGMVTAPSGRMDIVATKKAPLSLILRGGETLEVYGESPRNIFIRCEDAKLKAREHKEQVGLDFFIDTLDRKVRDEFSENT